MPSTEPGSKVNYDEDNGDEIYKADRSMMASRKVPLRSFADERENSANSLLINTYDMK